MTTEKTYSQVLSHIAQREVTVEYRKGYGWFIVDRGQTLMGFNTQKLLMKYIDKAAKRGFLYTPTKSETYGS